MTIIQILINMATIRFDKDKKTLVGPIFAVGNSGAVQIFKEWKDMVAKVEIFDKDNEDKILETLTKEPKGFGNSYAVFVPKIYIGKLANVKMLDKKEKK